jgi:peptide/nickel transport system permease protein
MTYVLRRLAQAIPILIGISIICFFFVRLSPGDPVLLVLNPDQLHGASEEQLARVREQLGLDQPLPVQYVKTMAGMLTGELRSFRSREPALKMIADSAPTTIALTLGTIFFGLLIGIPIGVLSALRPYSKLDHLLSVTSLFGISAPNFWLALMLILIFAEQWRILPSTGIRPVEATTYNPVEMVPHLVLPLLVLSSSFWASVARYVRGAMLETLNLDYVRTAHAKGLSARRVIVGHALRNSLLPVVTLTGTLLPILLGSAVVVETVFALPGMGRLAASSALTRDYPVVLTANMVAAVTVLVSSLCADLAYTVVDPRIRFE